jgi:uncharacterized protein (TIGR00369 family)
MSPEQFNNDPLPFARLLGITVTRTDPELVEGEMTVREDLCTSGQILHGGAVMAFADTLGAIATIVNLPQDAKGTATIESKTNFFRAAPLDTKLIGRSIPLHRGKTTQVWQTSIETEAGKSIAVITQTQMVLR